MTPQPPERTSAIRYISSRFLDIAAHTGFRCQPARTTARLIRWAARCALGIPARALFRRWNFRLHLPPNWRGGGSTFTFVLREYYEPELLLLDTFLKPGMVAVDAGAGTGTGIYTFAAAAPVGASGRVAAVEPGVEGFAALRRLVALNTTDNVILRNQALSNQRGVARVSKVHGQANMLSLAPSADPASAHLVETVTLDSLVDSTPAHASRLSQARR